MNASEIIKFAIVLEEAGEFDSSGDVTEYLKRPSQWKGEFDAWRELESPRPGDDNWDEFMDMMESREEA